VGRQVVARSVEVTHHHMNFVDLLRDEYIYKGHWCQLVKLDLGHEVSRFPRRKNPWKGQFCVLVSYVTRSLTSMRTEQENARL